MKFSRDLTNTVTSVALQTVVGRLSQNGGKGFILSIPWLALSKFFFAGVARAKRAITAATPEANTMTSL